MKRRVKVVGIVVAIVAVVVVGYYVFFSNGAKSPEERFSRELTTEEQELVDTNAFTPETLARYDGKEGRKAYIAVNGAVYDVTDHWKDGEHHGLSAGYDVTRGFLDSPHGASTLKKLTVVGGYHDDSR